MFYHTVHVQCFTFFICACNLYAALLQRTNGSAVILLKKIANVSPDAWPEVAAHLGCSAAYIEATHNTKEHMHGDARLYDDRCFTIVAMDWGDSEKGTGSMPRNWKTVLDVYRKCASTDSELAELATFQYRLVHGEQY